MAVRVLVAFFLLAVASPAASSNPRMATKPPAISFQYEDSRIYVPVRIGSGAPHWFILDTGATGTIIDTAVAKAAGLALSGGQTVHGAGSGGSTQSQTSAVDLRVGPVPLHVQQPLVMDLAHLLGPTSGRAPAGIIGSQFFREHFVDVDFAARRVTVYPNGGARRPSYAARVPLTFADWTPLTHIKLALPPGRVVTANALIDLGAKSTFLIPEPFIAREKLRDAFSHTVVTGLGAGVGGDTFYAFARARRLSLASAPVMMLDDPVVGLSVKGTLRSTWNEGLLGTDFLSRFRLGFDYAHHQLWLTKVGNSPEPFDRSGLFLAATAGDLDRVTVRQVLKGGPGEAAGLAVGDEILAVDGEPVAKIGLARLRQRLKTPGVRLAALDYERGGKPGSAILHLRDLL